MPLRFFCPVLLSLILIAPGVHTLAQAHVTENQSIYLYVDLSVGQDSNPGTQSAPLRTIQAAVNKAKGLGTSGGGVKVIVNAGVYRERVTISNYGWGGGTLTVQSATPGSAIISGSAVLTGWGYVSSSVYSRAWNYFLDACSTPVGWPINFAPIALRNEMFFVNGTPTTQVMSQGDLRPGTFYIDDWGGTVYLSPPSGTNMNTALIEAAVRAQDLTITGSSNVVVRGLVFRHASSCIQGTSMSINNSSNILVDSVRAVWNNWGGIGIYNSNNITLQNSTASYNGGVGFQGSRDQFVLLNSNHTDYNNWRGAQAALYDWGMGGAKFLQMRNTTVQYHSSFRNQAQGLWFDTDNKNIQINHVTLADNVLAALQMERSEGPITLENSTLCSSGGGINLLTSSNFTVKNNKFYNNGGTNRWEAQLFAGGSSSGYPIFDWLTGAYYDVFDSDLTVTGNVFEDAGIGQVVFGTYLSGYAWTLFANTLNAGGNTWYDPNTLKAFKINNGKFVTLSGWQSTVGTDFNSYWGPPTVSPASACGVPAPSDSDFSINTDNREYQMTSSVAVVTIRIASFGAGMVNLRATGIPSGVTGKFSTTSVQSGVVEFTVTATAEAYYTSLPITVWANSGSRVHSITFFVDVAPPVSYYP